MAKADDSSLDPEQVGAVQLAARRALDRATGWGVFPTSIPDILEAAKLKIAPASAFDPRRIVEYLMGKSEHAAEALKSAISKVFGIYDADESLISFAVTHVRRRKRHGPVDDDELSVGLRIRRSGPIIVAAGLGDFRPRMATAAITAKKPNDSKQMPGMP